MLISNCEPILKAIVSKFDGFNNANNIGEAFEEQARGSFMESHADGYGEMNSNSKASKEETQ